MQFTVTKDIFLKGLQRVQSIVEKRNTMPILSNVLLETVDDRLDITATDLEVGMKSSYPVTTVKPGKITVSAKKLFEIIRELPDADITFSTKENDWVELRCGKALFNIVGLSPEEFPYFPSIQENNFIKIESEVLRDMIEKTSFAICHDETKYNLNGVFLKGVEADGKTALKMVATDGHRLSLMEKTLEGSFGPELSKGVIFPKKGIFEIKKFAEEDPCELLLGFLDNSAVIKKNNTVVVMRLVDGEFPDYTRVIPQNNDRIVKVDREQFLHSLRRMAILSSEKSKGVKLEIDREKMIISSSNPELGEAREDLESDYAGEPLQIGFNARYLLDVLGVIDCRTVMLCLRDELSPALIRPAEKEDFTSVIMPMRL